MGFLLLLSSSAEGGSVISCLGSPANYKGVSSSWNNCLGTQIYAKGGKYVGGWKDGNFHGQGTYFYLADNQFNGDKYVGEFKDDKYNGQGTYTHADGSVQSGIWKGGNFLGDQ